MDAAAIGPFGRVVAAALLAGALLASSLSLLPQPLACVVLAAAAACLWRRPGATRVLGAFVAGFAGFAIHAHAALALRLDPALEDTALHVEGRVVGLPEYRGERQRFEFAVERAESAGTPVLIRGLVRLALYRDPVAVAAGERLVLEVRLRRPRGLRNPGGFDFERLALERRYAAVGHVRRVIAREPPQGGIDARRESISRWIGEGVEDPPTAALLRALAVGDQAAIPEPLWDVFRATGTTHLVAISGFHIGLAGALFGLLGALLHRLLPRLALRWPRRPMVAVCALAGAAAYSLLAGMSLPVQRTLAMLAAVLLAVVLRRHLAAGRALALAVLVVMALDPLALLNAGFWLSFGGVFWLLFALDGRSRDAWWRTYARAQWASFIALLPFGIAWFQQASLVGPLVNFAAIPWVSFVLVPLVLLAIALQGWAEPVAQLLLQLAGAVGAVYLDGLALAAGVPWADVPLPPPSVPILLLAVAGAGIALLPRAVPARWLGLVMLLPLAWPRIEQPPHGAFDLTVLDVGQGLAVVVRTREHALLYDAGPSRPEGFDSGQAIVAPALRTLGIRRLDRLVASHGDNDHAGGVPAVLRSHRPAVVQSGPGAGIGTPCVAGERWTWDGVAFEFLHPPAHFPALRNEASCVLRIDVGGHSALLPGDIGAVVEQRLLRAGAPLRASLLLLPHHGSRGSGSAAFLDAVGPSHAIVSAGFRNRFGHPAPEVVARVQGIGGDVHATAAGGALRMRVDDVGVRLLAAERTDARRLWQEP